MARLGRATKDIVRPLTLPARERDPSEGLKEKCYTV